MRLILNGGGSDEQIKESLEIFNGEHKKVVFPEEEVLYWLGGKKKSENINNVVEF